MRKWFAVLVAAMIVAGSPAALGGFGSALERVREGLPASAIVAQGARGWLWPIELWGACAWAARRLLASDRHDAAALVALLPLLSMLGASLFDAA